jgi:type I restriction-modification system DNA methylase subunit
MPQTRFTFPPIDDQKIQALDDKLREIYLTLRRAFRQISTLQGVLNNSGSYQSRDLVERQEPEEFVKRNLIEPLIDLLGYEIVAETPITAPSGSTRTPDYSIKPRGKSEPKFYVEAEPLNINLHAANHGVSQVEFWISLRSSDTDYGIATNGLDWILLKYDDNSHETDEIFQINLRPLLIRFLNRSLATEETLLEIKKNFLTLDIDYISPFLNHYLEDLDREREDISKRFYNEYVKYIFGVDEEGNQFQGVSLLNKIVRPTNVTNDEARLFAVIFMNRMIFVKFLEQKGLVERDFLDNLLGEYKQSHLMLSFYRMYLQPLFYEVFNKGSNNRTHAIQLNPFFNNIPYLNGGLFRQTLRFEQDYDIENDGIELILDNLLEKYDFGEGQEIDPNILGYIFEKTINFISGSGETNAQKMKGAYYTPDDLVKFIIEETVVPVIYRKMIESLRQSGWSDTDLRGYNSLADIFAHLPNNPVHVQNMIDSIDTVKILDPACGSGHFLTGTLSEILHIKESLFRILGREVDRCKLKRDIISKNLFGVDMDENAVEIAKLRLWLSIIQDVEGSTHIQTLPNIDYNIFSGNSLIGWLNESLVTHPLTNITQISSINEKLNHLRSTNRTAVEEIEQLLSTSTLESVVNAYRKLVAIYTLESGERAVEIRGIIFEIRQALYEVINQSYIDFLHENGHFLTQSLARISRDLTSLTPFHWRIDFQNVLSQGGFDVIVGNPPYGNILKVSEEEIMFYYTTKNANEIAANFLERIFPVVKKNGFIGLVLANSIAINASTSTARTVIRQNMMKSKMALFGTRPAKLFKGVEIRAMIFEGEKDSPTTEGTILTTEAIKFTTEQRNRLLENLHFESTEGLTLGRNKIGDGLEDNSLPKVGGSNIRNILLKLRDASTITTAERMNKESFSVALDFRKTGGYWLNALETFPYRSTKIETIHFEDEIDRNFALLLINSSLFYLYWSTYSNLRDFPLSLLEKFPFPTREVLQNHAVEILNLKNRISTCLVGSFISHNNTDSGRVGEFRTGHCRSEIEEIDDLIGPIYGLNEPEITFVKNYDIHIRK